MAFYIYLFLCMLNGFALGEAGINFTSWQFWVSIGCVLGAYICGAEKRN